MDTAPAPAQDHLQDHPQHHARRDPLPGRALVLGGGGSTGNAWLVGVMAGLAEGGVDVTRADVTVGTSAGATAAAQAAGSDLAALFAATLVPPPGRARPPAAAPGPASGAAARPVEDHLDRLRATIDRAEDAAGMRRALCRAALGRDTASDGSWSARWRETVAARLPLDRWPERRLLLTAVDVRTAEPVVLDRDSGVDLVDAVAASCSSGLPYRVDGRLLLDGGFRRNENADLAAGCGTVLVLSPFGGRSLTPPSWRLQLSAQVEELRAAGSEVEVVGPEAASEHLFGARAMDLSLRPEAARAGHAQGVALAGRLAAAWD